MKVDPSHISASDAYFWQIATIVPRPIAWTSTLNEDGSANLAPFSFFTGAGSEPPLCIIVVSRRRPRSGETAGAPDQQGPAPKIPKDTWRNIERTGDFVIHMVTEDLAEAMNVTSAEFPYGVDEFEAAGLTKIASDRVTPPRIAEAPVAMECKLERIVEVGHGQTAVIIGEIVLWHVRDDVVVEGRIDAEKLQVVGRMAGARYARTRDLFTMARPQPPKPPDTR